MGFLHWNIKRSFLFSALGIGFLVLACASLLFVLNNPAGAQDPQDGEPDPALMAFSPGSVAEDQLPLRVSVNYANDIIEEGYAPGHTVWITVTDHAGVRKATIELLTQEIEFWSVDEPDTWLTGFSTELGTWVPGKPDIVPGDLVEASSSEGYTTTMYVGDVSGNISLGASAGIITGTVNAPWLLPEDVEVKCKAFDPVTRAYTQKFDEAADRSTDPDGNDVYTCIFPNDQWRLRPGHLIAVSYDPLRPAKRGDRSLNVFPVPGPYLQVQTWATGLPGVLNPGPAGIPGNLILNVGYRNTGTVAATQVVITSTLQGLTFLADTSGFPRTGAGTSGEPLRWTVGTVPPGEYVEFQVFTTVLADVGNVSTQVQIASAEANMGFASERRSSWSSTVHSQGSWLTVQKTTRTRNPAPGQQVIYAIDVCNVRFRWPVDSTETTVTDTLPEGTTFRGWWSEEPAWQFGGANGQELVFTSPSVSAYTCSVIYVRAAVDAAVAPGTSLCSSATVEAANNNAPSRYRTSTACHTAGLPNPELAIEKTWAGGQLVQGGRLGYEVIVRNTGNVPITGQVTLADTIPAYATFVEAVADDAAPFTFNLIPTVSGNQLIWQFSGIGAGEWARFWLTFALDENVPVPTEVTNVISLSGSGLQPASATWSETIRESGPNLRVRKTGEWVRAGSQHHRIHYRIDIENVGDQKVYDLTLADTFDSAMQIAGPVFVDIWYRTGVTVAGPGPSNSFTARLPRALEPGKSFTVEFDTWLTSGDGWYPSGSLAAGQEFINTATVTAPLPDIDPGDNTARVTVEVDPDFQQWSIYIPLASRNSSP
jgi:uncharacterized repeat protein (TIGR01451 family)